MMKRFSTAFLTFCLLTVLAGCGAPDKAEAPYSSFKPYTRWWWFSAETENKDIRDQLVWLQDHGFGGVEIAWIYPLFLKNDTPHPDFLSERWGDAVAYAKHVADSLGMGCDFTYGSLWPFSDVDLPPGDGTRNYFDSVEVARRRYTWDHPREARILNHLDSTAFYRYAEKMNRGLEKAYSGSPSALFVDSWEVETEYLWTPGFAELFMKEHGYDIEPYMRERTLYDEENRDVKYDYMKTLSDLVLREFYIPFARNAAATGNLSRAQCGGAPTDLLTAFTVVDVPETEAILYEPSFSRIPASAATIAGKEVVSSETFTCMYGWTGLSYMQGRGRSPHQGEEQIADLKLVCDALFAGGTNQIVWHGFPYNKVGRSDGWFYTTCEIGTDDRHSLSGDALTAFNAYMTKVSGYMRAGKNYTDLAVYMPLEDAWMGGSYPEEITSLMPWALGEYEMRYIRVPEMLKGRQPLWVNGRFLSGASFRDGLLSCGDASFRGLYIDVAHMDYTSLEAVLRLAKEGLPVCVARLPEEPGRGRHENYGDLLSELLSLPSVTNDPSALPGSPLLEGENIPDFWCRRDGDRFFIFFANPLTASVSYPLPYGLAFTDKGGKAEISVNHHGRTEAYTLVFKPMESILLEVSRGGIKKIDLGYTPPEMSKKQ